MRWMSFLRNFPLGVFLGLQLGLILAWIWDSELADLFKQNASDFLAALVTLIASAVALAAVFWKTEHQRSRKLAAARAVLPMALTKLIEVSRHGIDYSLRDESFLKDVSNFDEVQAALSLPDSTLQILKENIENASPEEEKWLSLIIGHYQIYRSRLLGLISDPNRIVVDYNRASLASDWCLLHALAEHLFDFARTGTPPAQHLNPERLGIPMFDRMDSTLAHEVLECNRDRMDAAQSLTAEHLVPAKI